MTDTREPEVGDILDDRYRLVELVGTGGMAHVYRADDLALGRVVAVKVMHARGAEQSGQERIRGEVNLLASVSGHSLVTLYDAHVPDSGPAYLVMELVSGPTLSARLSEGALPLRELDDLAVDLAEALHTVHAAGIVHRDVKPSNVLLTSTPVPARPYRAKLADFGIAHLLDATRVTTPGLTVGTAAYIAPELLDGADPAPPSDIYALGLVLIEAATGRRAFDLTDPRAQVLARLTRDPVVPASLDARRSELLMRLTARVPEARPDADEVLALLSALPPAAHATRSAPPATETAALVATATTAAAVARRPVAEILAPTAVFPLDTADERRSEDAGFEPEGADDNLPSRVRRAALWAGSIAAAAVLVATMWSVTAGVSPTTDPTPSITPTIDAPAAPVSESPAVQGTVAEDPGVTDTGSPVTDEQSTGNGNSGNGGGNSGNGNGNGGGNGNGNSGNGNDGGNGSTP